MSMLNDAQKKNHKLISEKFNRKMDTDIKEEPVVITHFVRKRNLEFLIQREYLNSSSSSTERMNRLLPVETNENINFSSKYSIATETSTGCAIGDVLHGPSTFSSQKFSREKFHNSKISEFPLERTPVAVEFSAFGNTKSRANNDYNLEQRENLCGTKFSCIPLRYIQNYDASHLKHRPSREILISDVQRNDQSQFVTYTSTNRNNDTYSNSLTAPHDEYPKPQNPNQNSYPILEQDHYMSYPIPKDPKNISYVEQRRSHLTHHQAAHEAGPSYFVDPVSDDEYPSRIQYNNSRAMFSDNQLICDPDSTSQHENDSRYSAITTQSRGDSFKMRQPNKGSLYYITKPENNYIGRAQVMNEDRQSARQGREFLSNSMETNEYAIRRQRNEFLNMSPEQIPRHSTSNSCNMSVHKHQITSVPHIEESKFNSVSENLYRIQRDQCDEDLLINEHLSQTMNRTHPNCPNTSSVIQRQMPGYRTTQINRNVSVPQSEKFASVPRFQTRLLEKVSVNQIPKGISNTHIISTDRLMPKYVQHVRTEVHHPNISTTEMHVPRTAPFLHKQIPKEETATEVYVLQRKVPVNPASHREQLSDVIYLPERDIYVESRFPDVEHVSILKQAPRNSYSHVPHNALVPEGSVPLFTRTPERLLLKKLHPLERFRTADANNVGLQKNSLATQQMEHGISHGIPVQMHENQHPEITQKLPTSNYFSMETPKMIDRTSKPNGGISVSTSKSNTNFRDPCLPHPSCMFSSLQEEKVKTSPSYSDENSRASIQISDANMDTTGFNQKENFDVATQNFENFDESAPTPKQKFESSAFPSSKDLNTSYLDRREGSNNTGSALRENPGIQAPILQRALQEPLTSPQRERILPTILDEFNFDDSCSQPTQESHRPDSLSPAHSDCAADYTDEDEQDTGTSLKRVQHCTFCRNHGVTVRKFGHVCQRKTCECILCKLTLHHQVIMKQQQALWRRQTKELKGNPLHKQLTSCKKEKLCDKCRNHNKVSEKRGHVNSCRFERCRCDLCALTDKRRRVTKYLQRIRRAKVTSEEMDMIWEEINEQRLESPLASQSSTSETQDQFCGQPVRQFVSCLVPDSMSQNEIRHFFYPRPHPADKSSDRDLDSVCNERDVAGVLGDEASGRKTAASLGEDIVEENPTAFRSSIYPLKDQQNYKQLNSPENCGVHSSSKELCMAEKKKIVEGREGNFRELFSYSDQFRENNGMSSGYVNESTLPRGPCNEDALEISAHDKKAAQAHSSTGIDTGRTSSRSMWSESNKYTDDRMETVEVEQALVIGRDEEIEREAPMTKDVDNYQRNPTSQVPTFSRVNQRIEGEKSSTRRTYVKRRKRKRTQSCTFCQNHGFTIPKPGHNCPYSHCECLLCRLTKLARIVMKHQQALWRHQARELKKNTLGNLPKLRQVCDKCRNHNQLHKKSGHSSCEFEKCTCPLCTLTEKRRFVMMHLQRIRRAQVTSKALSSSENEESDADQMTDKVRKSEDDDFEPNKECQSVAAVIDSVTQALRALPPSLQHLSTELGIDHKQTATTPGTETAHVEMEVVKQDPIESNEVMKMDESVSNISEHKLTQL
ncbi:DM DNA-binding domain [Trinorchestia longiramus]|nr:DM DNA-binding domain [Trinorchestia longiramus]